jgi:hypothetical protein
MGRTAYKLRLYEKEVEIMPIQTIRIHPAIGIARVGNSPEYFIGPLKPGEPAAPAGGFKDPSGNLKPQAAQFRLYAYDEAGRLMGEITAAEARITWTAHLVNKKAEAENFPSGPDRRNPQVTNPADRMRLIIDPQSRSLTGPNQSARFDTGTFKLPDTPAVLVPLGRMETDGFGRLVVIGGFGQSKSPNGRPLQTTFNNSYWYDDVADGPISATVSIGNQTFTAEGAWVIVGPPKYAPGIPHAITLWDRLQDFFFGESQTAPSYVKDIFPILESATGVYGVQNVGRAHSSPMWQNPVIDPTARQRIFDRLNLPPLQEVSWEGLTEDSELGLVAAGGMPQLIQATLTKRQYNNMRMWRDGNFINDWPPRVPAEIAPEGLDQAALENCVGAAFFPGIEGGDFLLHKPNYVRPYRLNHTRVRPGDVTARMALPWQSDFYACANNWWPPARPNQVIPRGTTAYLEWARGVANAELMVQKWFQLGFVLKQADGLYREVDRGPVLAEADEAEMYKAAVPVEKQA